MAGANSNIQLSGLDFDNIKNNLRTFLQSQDTFKDYNFEGAGLSVLLDILAFNTQYNAFYLNMVANEMFLDTALQRSSVVSHAKLLNYTPQSSIGAVANVDIYFSGVTTSSVTLPAYTSFLSESIDGTNYNFVTIDNTTVDTNANTSPTTAIMSNVQIKQGNPVTYTYTVDSTSNPEYAFDLPDNNIDLGTLRVIVQKSSSNTYSSVYSLASDYLVLDQNSTVYFLQESLTGNYQLIFGNGILGKKLDDGNIVVATYVVTQGSSAAGANNFVLIDSLPGVSTSTVYGNVPAFGGGEKETIERIKYMAPKAYAAQNRAVTKEDYITLLQQNKIGLSFDAVNVWGGEENNPPVYGSIFICLKPKGGYSLTDVQKQKLIQTTIRPISVMTVQPKIIDPDYTYIQITADVLYDQKKTNLSKSQLSDLIKVLINQYVNNNLNTFNSFFSSTDVAIAIKNANQSILTSDINVKIQKKIYPDLTNSTTYQLYYNTPLKRGLFSNGVSSNPDFSTIDPNTQLVVSGVYIEETPSTTSGIDTISVINPGYSYQYTPTVTISGDGQGATAIAKMVNGSISQINVTSSGNNYTSAIVTIEPSKYDTTGTGASAVVNFRNNLGKLRTYYFNQNNIKTILNDSAGTIDYENGVITLDGFSPIAIENELGQLTVISNPTTNLLQSSYNTIITVDPFDQNSIVVNLKSK